MASLFLSSTMNYLTGVAAGAAGVTSAVIVRIVWAGSVFAVTVTFFVCLFFFPLELNFTSILPVAPGAIGSFGHCGTVHPQDPLQLSRMSGSAPVFVNSK